MTRRSVLRSLVTSAAAVPVIASARQADARLVPADPKPELEYVQDGKDLVVRLQVVANNSPHALWTNVLGAEQDRPVLRYYVVQNQDCFVRSQKRVTVEWRLPGRKQDEVRVQVEERFTPGTAELRMLMPQLQRLVEAGEAVSSQRAS